MVRFGGCGVASAWLERACVVGRCAGKAQPLHERRAAFARHDDRSRPRSRSASAPSPASPTTSRSGRASRIMRKPPRTSAWSSASTTRMLTERTSSGSARARGSRRRSPARPRACRPASPRARACPRCRGRSRRLTDCCRRDRRRAISSSSTPAARADRHLGAARARVPQRVRERLLDDPVRRQVDAGGQRAERRRPRCGSVTSSPAARSATASSRDAREPGLRRPRLVVHPSGRREQPAQTPRAPRAPLASIERSAARAWSGCSSKNVVGRRRLHDDHRRRSARSRRAARARCAPARRRPPGASPARSRHAGCAAPRRAPTPRSGSPSRSPRPRPDRSRS